MHSGQGAGHWRRREAVQRDGFVCRRCVWLDDVDVPHIAASLSLSLLRLIVFLHFCCFCVCVLCLVDEKCCKVGCNDNPSECDASCTSFAGNYKFLNAKFWGATGRRSPQCPNFYGQCASIVMRRRRSLLRRPQRGRKSNAAAAIAAAAI